MVSDHHKFVFVLNKKIEPPRLLNAVGHMAAVLAAKANEEQKKDMSFVDYVDADKNTHPVSALSLVILKADNANQIRTARTSAIGSNIMYADFFESMTQGSYSEQMEKTAKLPESELAYWGLGLFGPVDILKEITKKFSLYS